MRNVLIATATAIALAASTAQQAQADPKPKLDITVVSTLGFDATMEALKKGGYRR